VVEVEECDSEFVCVCPSGVVVFSVRDELCSRSAAVIPEFALPFGFVPLWLSVRSWLRVTVVPSGIVSWRVACWCLRDVVCCVSPYGLVAVVLCWSVRVDVEVV
jgi:hypothetical protein